MDASRQMLLREIPSIDACLREWADQAWSQAVPRAVLADLVREEAERIREELAAEGAEPRPPAQIRAALLAAVQARVEAERGPFYRKVINATGIILHTALGRAVLPAQAIRQIQEELSGYSLLQADLQTGARSRRDGRIERLLRKLTGCEAATVVNNNAAATAIVLNTLARGREVIVSRGQLVEIGGSFRLPEVMAAAGARLVEVGTTNKTHLSDYENAITGNTAAILRVHPSNYRVIGFASEVPLEDLVRLAHARGLPVIDDVGAGALFDLAAAGLPPEPTLPGSIAAGADLVVASADKLIGSSQGGLVLGRAELIQAVRKNPFARIVRVGKLTLAALEATLTLFLDEQTAWREVPTLRMLRRDQADIERQAAGIAGSIQQTTNAIVEVIAGASEAGSGSLPGRDLPTTLVAVAPARLDAAELARRLRLHRPPIFARVHKDRLLIDPRTLLAGEDRLVAAALAAILAEDGNPGDAH